MQCPKCKIELRPAERSATDPFTEKPSPEKPGAVAATPEEALRADTPPAPCPECGWSTMWNE